MTLGKKLSNYRKNLGWTQQQLGDHLNLSPQAISKWENNLAEPDLTTLKSLATLYNVSVDELLDTSDEQENVPEPASEDKPETDNTAEEIKKLQDTVPIAFCKKCGMGITLKTLGTRTPVVMCKSCVEKARVEKAQEKRKDEAKVRAVQSKLTNKKRTSLIVASIATVAYCIAFLILILAHYSTPLLIAGLALIYPVFAFVALLFYDTPVSDVLDYMLTSSITWPGLIFTFDLDGIIWLISMKLLFAVISFFFGILCALLGIALGLLIAPFVFPFTLVKFNNDIKNGVVGEYIK